LEVQSQVIRIEIDGTPPSLNKWARLHWGHQRKMKQDWAWLIKAAVLAAKIGRPEIKFARVTIILSFPVNRRRDIDNYTPKVILDGLVAAGVIMDDRSDWIDVQWRLVKGDKRCTVIEVVEYETCVTV
jgi:Holliday junction resolvase RusA-like endonuclease